MMSSSMEMSGTDSKCFFAFFASGPSSPLPSLWPPLSRSTVSGTVVTVSGTCCTLLAPSLNLLDTATVSKDIGDAERWACVSGVSVACGPSVVCGQAALSSLTLAPAECECDLDVPVLITRDLPQPVSRVLLTLEDRFLKKGCEHHCQHVEL